MVPSVRLLGGVYPDGGEGEVFFQRSAQGLAEVGHALKIRGLFLPQPFIDLFGPERLFAHLFKYFLDLGKAQVPDILLPHHPAKVRSYFGFEIREEARNTG